MGLSWSQLSTYIWKLYIDKRLPESSLFQRNRDRGKFIVEDGSLKSLNYGGKLENFHPCRYNGDLSESRVILLRG